MLPVLRLVVRGKQGHAPCLTTCCYGYARACSLSYDLWLGVSKGMLPVLRLMVRGKQGHAPCLMTYG